MTQSGHHLGLGSNSIPARAYGMLGPSMRIKLGGLEGTHTQESAFGLVGIHGYPHNIARARLFDSDCAAYGTAASAGGHCRHDCARSHWSHNRVWRHATAADRRLYSGY